MKTVYEVLERLDGVKRQDGYWIARCPAHDDETPSLSITEGRESRPLLNCHTGCEFVDICAAIGFKAHELLPDREPMTINGNGKRSRQMIASYDYTDVEDRVLLQVVRWSDKTFSQRRPNGKGGWIWNAQGVPRVLFRLSRVRSAVAARATVFIVEGEKDVLALEGWKLCATTNAGGAGKWTEAHTQPLIGAHRVVIVADNDEAGRQHAREVADALDGKVESVHLLELPGLGEGGDVSDWIQSGGTFDEFTRLVRACAVWTPTPREDLPAIIVSNRPLRDLSREAIQALALANTPPRLFVRTGFLARWRQDEKGRPMIETLTAHHIRGLLTRSADFLQVGKQGPKHISPPDHVVADILVVGGWMFPNLKGITETPVLRPDGSILETPGYDSATQLVYAPNSGLSAPQTPVAPTPRQVEEALELVWSAIGEFPYQDQASRANTLALLLTPILRPAILGPVPLALIDAPQQGTGKSLLAETITLIITGRPAAMMQAPKEDEEWRKSLTASFRNGDSMMIYDNIESRISAPALAMAITSAVWKDRILGGSEVFEFPVECTWMATGNNLQPDGDMPRRSYWIRLDAEMSQPWRRTGFQHPDLRAWVLENRGRLVVALLTICRAWFAAGRPKAEVPLMGSFEKWTRVVGGVLAFAGVAGFLGNLDAMFEQIDTTSQQWETFLVCWDGVYGDSEQKIAVLIADLRSVSQKAIAMDLPDPAKENLRDAVPDEIKLDMNLSDDVLRTRLGVWLKRKLGVRYGSEGWRIEMGADDTHKNVKRWRVVHDDQ